MTHNPLSTQDGLLHHQVGKFGAILRHPRKACRTLWMCVLVRSANPLMISRAQAHTRTPLGREGGQCPPQNQARQGLPLVPQHIHSGMSNMAERMTAIGTETPIIYHRHAREIWWTRSIRMCSAVLAVPTRGCHGRQRLPLPLQARIHGHRLVVRVRDPPPSLPRQRDHRRRAPERSHLARMHCSRSYRTQGRDW